MKKRILYLFIIITANPLILKTMDNDQIAHLHAASTQKIKELQKILDYATVAQILKTLGSETTATFACLLEIPFLKENTYLQESSFPIESTEFKRLVEGKLDEEQEKYYKSLLIPLEKRDNHDPK